MLLLMFAFRNLKDDKGKVEVVLIGEICEIIMKATWQHDIFDELFLFLIDAIPLLPKTNVIYQIKERY